MTHPPQPVTNLARIMGLDIGDRRIGVAISDGLGLTAQPVFTLHRSNPREDIRSIARLTRKHEATAIVAGLPLHMSGDLSPQAQKSQAFAQELAERTGLALYFWDERLTSHAAHEILDVSGFGTTGRKAVIDQVAAVLILQGFLDAQRGPTLLPPQNV
jgi:putative holliday junction resolvase